MHIALISEHASPLATLGGVDAGGQNVYVAQTARLLARKGHIVDVYTRRSCVSQPETITLRPGLRVVHVSAGPPSAMPKERLAEYMPAFAREVEERVRREGRPDVVHAHFWMSGVVALELKRRLGIPFVITFHALGRVRRLHQGGADGFPENRGDIERELMAEAQQVIAECPQDVADMRRFYSADTSRIVQVPCGFDPEEISPVDKRLARELLGVDPGMQVVLQLGRMVPRKGVDDAIRGFARATVGAEDRALLLVVGGDDAAGPVATTAEGRRLIEVAREEGAEGHVRLVGSKSRQSIRYFYSAADVFVSVPWYEPFGITPLEAMACGTPVLGSAVGGVKHSVVDGRTGVLVEPHDPDAVARGLRLLLDDDRLRDRMGQAGRERVNAEFTWERVTEALAAIYESAVVPERSVTAEALVGELTLGAVARSLIPLAAGVEAETERAARLLADTVTTGGTVLVCGNGGSASDGHHFAAELVGRYGFERGAVPAISLTSDPAVVTAVSNDYGFDRVFERQVEALGRPDGLLLAISTTGNSPNVIRALDAARAKGMRTVGLLGGDGGGARPLCDVAAVVPTNVTARVQEVHQLIIHYLAGAIDDAYLSMLPVFDLSLATTLSDRGYWA